MANAPDVTILIRARNEEKLLPRCLAMIFRQETTFSYEILLIDSGSTDRTVEIARQFAGVTIRAIDPAAFNYGATLNDGVRLSRGRYVIALSAHCVPVDVYWLQRLLEPLEREPVVGGSFSRQLPWPDCELVERLFLQKVFTTDDFLLTKADENPFQILYSNASSCFRRELARTIPFRALPWAEDRVWAQAVLRAGYAIAYASRSQVYHSHQRTIWGYYRMGYAEGRAQALVGCPPVSLRSRPWFGIRPLWWTFQRWRRICAGQVVRPSAVLQQALGSLGRVMALDLGVRFGHMSALKGVNRVGLMVRARASHDG